MFQSLEEIKGKTYYLRNIDPNEWSKVRRFDFTTDGIGPGINKHGLPETGLTEDRFDVKPDGKKEQIKGTRAILEKALGMDEGALKRGTTTKPSPFWTMFEVKMEKADVPLNGDDPEDQLKILFLAAQSNVAVGVKNRKAKSEYLLFTKEEAAIDSNNRKKIKREAYKLFEDLTLEEKCEILEMMGVKAKTLSADVVEDKLSDLLEDSTKRFLAIVKDPKRKQKSYVRKCLDIGIMTMEEEAVLYGETVLGYDINSAADALFSDEHAKTREALKIQFTNGNK